MAEVVRVMIVDDSALYRQLVRNLLREIPDIEVVGSASSGSEALEKIDSFNPDLLTLDVEMPDVNGIAVLRALRQKRSRVKAIMLSSLTMNGAQVTTDALLAGAFDFIHKPNNLDATKNRTVLLQQLTEKIEAFRESLKSSLPRRSFLAKGSGDKTPANSSSPLNISKTHDDLGIHAHLASGAGTHSGIAFEAIAIGSSTGGPVALREVLAKLPVHTGLPVFVVQHMPAHYTTSLADRLNDACRIAVCEARDGMLIEPNKVYIAPGGSHLCVATYHGKKIIRTTDDPPEQSCRPAVDYTFRSVAEAYNGKVIGVVLTGMGRDGAEGCRVIKQRGGYVIAQHPEGCVVYGMPKVVVEQGLADRVVPLDKIAAWISFQLAAN